MDSFVNATVTPFFYLFSEKGKGKSYDKSALLHVKIITSCLTVTAALSQVELKSGRRNSPNYLLIGVTSFKIYRKDSCISRTFLLKFWAKNRRCGLYTRPSLSERVNWLVVVTN